MLCHFEKIKFILLTGMYRRVLVH